MRRHIFIGDIHGCIDEVRDLLRKLSPRPDEVVVALGDLSRKGPASADVLDLWVEKGYLAVRGNQDQKIVTAASRAWKRIFMEPADKSLLRRKDLIHYLARLPLWLDFPDIGVLAVHAGVRPGTTIESGLAQCEKDLLNLRYVRIDNGRWVAAGKRQEQPGDRFWTDVWDGDRTVVYGHRPYEKVRFTVKTVGVDTSCVYGGKLSAAVFNGRNWDVVSVRARKAYAA